ncbi:MAG TPA: hypothetical protein PLN22_04035 [Ignavibacteria bacterium]|nr:hypothetical protein [Ignavibacteria bacterium]
MKTSRMAIYAMWNHSACRAWNVTNFDLSLLVAQKMIGKIIPPKNKDEKKAPAFSHLPVNYLDQGAFRMNLSYMYLYFNYSHQSPQGDP